MKPRYSDLVKAAPKTYGKLPKVKIGSKEYYRDDRLKELRNVDNPHDRIVFGNLRDFYDWLDEVIKDEEKAKEDYDKRGFYEIAEDERKHFEVFKKLRKDLVP